MRVFSFKPDEMLFILKALNALEKLQKIHSLVCDEKFVLPNEIQTMKEKVIKKLK
jgi:hypothetical protein